jgi:hypothetical protein
LTTLHDTLVVDDVISREDQDKFHELILRQPWMFLRDVSGVTQVPYPSFGLTSVFKRPNFDVDQTTSVLSPLYEAVSVPIINSAIEKLDLKISDIYFNRAFLQLPLATKYWKEHNGLHVDLPIPHLACVYYVNDSDGDTIIYEQNIHDTPLGSTGVELVEHRRVTPKKGRFVLFDGARYHCSSQPTENYRCIINFDLLF